MNDVTKSVKDESMNALRSTIQKSENALTQMTLKKSNTTLIMKRLKALKIGLAILENDGNQLTNLYDQVDLIDARNLLDGLLPSIERIYKQSKSNSAQQTLLERRLTALKLVIQMIDELTVYIV